MPTPRPPRPGDDCAHSEDEGSREGGPVTGLRGDAAIVGYSEWPSERRYQGPRSFQIEQWAQIAAEALDDAGIASSEVDGLVVLDLRESKDFVPATVAEYCGWEVNFAERMDLGGASPVGAVWRAAAAIELGLCETVVLLQMTTV